LGNREVEACEIDVDGSRWATTVASSVEEE
jgi:hypothetical protein